MPRYVVTPTMAAQITTDVLNGNSYSVVAKKHGISISTVGRVVQGRDPEPRGPLKPCGTNAAYMRHIRRGEPACLPCLKAHADEAKKWSRGNANAAEQKSA